MRPLPKDPHAFQQRVMDAVIADITDPQEQRWSRLDALREVSKRTDERDCEGQPE